MTATEYHEGEQLKNYLKGTGKSIEQYSVELETSRQSLYYHLSKPKLSADFKELMSNKFGISFTFVKNKGLIITSNADDNIEANNTGQSFGLKWINTLTKTVRDLFSTTDVDKDIADLRKENAEKALELQSMIIDKIADYEDKLAEKNSIINKLELELKQLKEGKG